MNKKLKTKKMIRTALGFTLIEIIVVVVILAILAALILPRFLTQPERANIAEAQQMLGGVRRAQLLRADLNNTTAYVGIQAGPTAAIGVNIDGTGDSDGDLITWVSMGLGALDAETRYDYNCTLGADGTSGNAIDPADQAPALNRPTANGAGTCTATRTTDIGGDGVADTITISMDFGSFTCAGAYRNITAGGDRGCAV